MQFWLVMYKECGNETAERSQAEILFEEEMPPNWILESAMMELSDGQFGSLGKLKWQE